MVLLLANGLLSFMTELSLQSAKPSMTDDSTITCYWTHYHSQLISNYSNCRDFKRFSLAAPSVSHLPPASRWKISMIGPYGYQVAIRLAGLMQYRIATDNETNRWTLPHCAPRATLYAWHLSIAVGYEIYEIPKFTVNTITYATIIINIWLLYTVVSRCNYQQW